MTDLRVRIFDNDSAPAGDFESLYQFSRECWMRTWKELHVDSSRPFDDFRRMKAHCGFFEGARPVAYGAFDLFDLRLPWHAHHSYFQRLPENVVAQLQERRLLRLGTLEYFTVAPDKRGTDVAEKLGAFSTQYLKTWNVDGLIALSRNDRGIGDMCRRFGASPLVKELVTYGVPTSVMVFERKGIVESDRLDIRSFVRQNLAALEASPAPALKRAS